MPFNTWLAKYKEKCAKDYITAAGKKPDSNITDIIKEIEELVWVAVEDYEPSVDEDTTITIEGRRCCCSD